MKTLPGLCLGALLMPCMGPVTHAATPCGAGVAETLNLQAATICIFVQDGTSARLSPAMHDWVQRSAQIVSQYYGRFPTPLLALRIALGEGAGVSGGRTSDDGELQIAVRVGREASAQSLNDDWVLVHEMVHLALPEMRRRQNWLGEGLAVYVEGIARAQSGNRSAADVWAEDRRQMPRGLPQPDEGGLDETPDWARTYWGGALFCLEADVAIRQRTANRLGLQRALRAILAETGGFASQRSIEDVLRIGDAATGTTALEDLYQREGRAAGAPDLNALWKALGVPDNPLTEPFDEHAPLAAIRRAITAR